MAVQDVRLATGLEEELERGVAEKVKLDAVVVPAVHRVHAEEAVLGLHEEHLNVLHDVTRHHNGGPERVEARLELHVTQHGGKVEELVLGQDDLH